MIRTLKILFGFFLLLGVVGWAQTSATITATIADGNGCAYKNGTYNWNMTDAQGNDLTPGSVIFFGGNPFYISPIYGTLNGFGQMSVNPFINSTITNPAGTKWNISICSQNPASVPGNAPVPPMQCFIYKGYTVVANTDITSVLQSSVPLVGCPSSGGGSGTVNPGTTNFLAFYPTNGNQVSATADVQDQTAPAQIAFAKPLALSTPNSANNVNTVITATNSTPIQMVGSSTLPGASNFGTIAGAYFAQVLTTPFTANQSAHVMGLYANGLYPGENQNQNGYSFKPGFNTLTVANENHAEGSINGLYVNQNQYGVGDTFGLLNVNACWSGTTAGGDEGCEASDNWVFQGSVDYAGTITSGGTTGSTSVTISPTQGSGTQGAGRFLYDTTVSKTITTNTIASIVQIGGTYSTYTGNSTGWPVSNVNTTLGTAVNPPGIVTVTPGSMTNISVGSKLCIADQGNFEMVQVTATTGTTFTANFLKAFSSSAIVAGGGLCGYSIGINADYASGLSGVTGTLIVAYPIIRSTSPTSLDAWLAYHNTWAAYPGTFLNAGSTAYTIYPSAEVQLVNNGTNGVTNTLTLAPNTVAWANTDTVDLPLYPWISEQNGNDLVFRYFQGGNVYGRLLQFGPAFSGGPTHNAAGMTFQNNTASSYYDATKNRYAPVGLYFPSGVWNNGLQMDNAPIEGMVDVHGCFGSGTCGLMTFLHSQVASGSDNLNYDQSLGNWSLTTGFNSGNGNLTVNGYVNATGGYKVNGNFVLPSFLTGYHGNSAGVNVQLETGATVSGNCAQFDANGNLKDAGVGCSTGGAFNGGTITNPIIGPSFQGNGLPTFDVRAYGAVCNGTTDDSTAINNAIIAANAAGGGQVVGPRGTVCSIGTNTAINMLSNVRLTSISIAPCATGGTCTHTGAMANAMIQTNSQALACPNNLFTNVQIDHIILSGGAPNTAGTVSGASGIDLFCTDNAKIDSNVISQMGWEGVLSEGSYNVQITNNNFSLIWGDCTDVGPGDGGIVEGNSCDGKYAATDGGFSTGAYNPFTFPARTNTTAYSTGANIDVTLGSGAGTIYRFIAITPGTSGGSAPTFSPTAGSTVVDGTVTWENVGALPFQSQNVRFAGNVVKALGGNSFGFEDAGGVSIVYDHNEVEGGYGNGHGFRVYQYGVCPGSTTCNAYQVTIADNIIGPAGTNSGYCINILEPNPLVQSGGIHIDDNQCYASSATTTGGFYLLGYSITASNNFILANAGGQSCIVVDSTMPNPTSHLSIHDNKLTSCATGINVGNTGFSTDVYVGPQQFNGVATPYSIPAAAAPSLEATYAQGVNSSADYRVNNTTVIPNNVNGFSGPASVTAAKIASVESPNVSGQCAQFNADGSISSSGAACGASGGTGVSQATSTSNTVILTPSGGTGVVDFKVAPFSINGTTITTGASTPNTVITAAPTGTASGDLGGTYPGPSVHGWNGGVIPNSANVLGTNSLGQPVSDSFTNITNLWSGTCAQGFFLQANGVCTPYTKTVAYTTNTVASINDNGALVLLASGVTYTLPATQPVSGFHVYVQLLNLSTTSAVIGLGSGATFFQGSITPTLSALKTVHIFANSGITTDYEGDYTANGLPNDVQVSVPSLVIPGNTCFGAGGNTTATTFTMTGLTTAMGVAPRYTGDPSGLTGYGGTGGLNIAAWPSASGQGSYKVCNTTANSITSSAITVVMVAN